MLFLADYFQQFQLTALPSAGTSATVFRVQADDQSYVLKVQSLAGATEHLGRERDVYAWLSGKVPVPEVKFLTEHDGMEYLCMCEVPGNTLETYQHVWSDQQLVTHYASALKKLHALPLDAAVPCWPLAERLHLAQMRLQRGAIDKDDIDTQYKQLSLEELFDEMMKVLPADLDEVCTHGDYCFDNLLFNGEMLSGFIDMGRGGRGDRYLDLAIAARSVRDAFGANMLEQFYSTYGISKPSDEKLRFYMMLDEFF